MISATKLNGQAEYTVKSLNDSVGRAARWRHDPDPTAKKFKLFFYPNARLSRLPSRKGLLAKAGLGRSITLPMGRARCGPRVAHEAPTWPELKTRVFTSTVWPVT